MYRSLGNILSSPRVGLLFLSFEGGRFDGSAARLRVTGRASIVENDPGMAAWPGAKRLIRLAVDRVFPNCPRYIPKMASVEPSVFTPKDGYDPPDPPWKMRDFVKDIFDAEQG